MESALPAQVVREARDGHRQVQSSGLFRLPQRSHVLADVGERRSRVTRGLRELGSKRRRIAIERALATLEREDHAGELLRHAVVQLLRDAPPLIRGGSLDEVGRRRLLQHPGEVLAKGRDEVGLGRRIGRCRATENKDTEHHAILRATDRRKKEVRRRRCGPVRSVLRHSVLRRRGAVLAKDLREHRIGARGGDVRRGDVAVAGRGPEVQVMLVRGPHADRVVTQVVGEHRDGTLEVVVRVDPERREPGELVQDEGLPAILLGALELFGRQKRRSDLGRRLRERIDLHLPVALLLGTMLHADDAERATVGPQGSDHRFTRGRVGAALDLAREQHRSTGLRDRPGDAFTDPLPIQLRDIRQAARAPHRELAVRVGQHDGDAVGAEHVGELCRRALEQLVRVTLFPDDRLKIARRFELRFGVLTLPLRAPERVRLGELEADEVPDAAQAGQVLGREGAAGEHRRKTADDLVFPDDRGHRESIGGAPVRESERHTARCLIGGALAHRFREHHRGQALAPPGVGREVVGDVRYVALALHLEDHGDGIRARNLREIGHARVPEFGVESEGQGEALRHAGAGLALDAELQRGAAAALQGEARLFQGRDRGPELVHQHGYAESDRERRDASPEVTHVERTDLRQRLDTPFDVHEPGK